MTYTPVKQQEKKYSITNTSTPKHHIQFIGAISVCLFSLNTTAKLPPAGKEYMCFHIDGKSAQASTFVKSKIITKVIDCVLSVNISVQQCVMLKCMLQSPRLKYHINTIGIDQSLSNSSLFEHRFL